MVAVLDKVKNDSPGKGREYVKAYVDYTHTLEAIHDIIEQGGGNSAHKHWIKKANQEILILESSPIYFGEDSSF